MDLTLLHPASAADVADLLHESSTSGRRVLPVGGRRHLDKGNPAEVDAELWTTQLDAIVSYEPAEMVAVVGAGARVRDLDAALAEGGQEWPHDAPPDATVGGVIASAATSPRRLRVGPVRDTVLEVELVTGDGRFVKGGGRTVKNVTGYDLPRLLTGSLGTLGVLTQVALKVRPLPSARRTVRVRTGDPFGTGDRALAALPTATAVLATPEGIEVRLEGWPDEVRGQTDALGDALASASSAGTTEVLDDAPFPAPAQWADAPIVVEVAVAPSRIAPIARAAAERWSAPLGTGLLWVGLEDAADLDRFRAAVRDAGGIAPVIRGPGGLGNDAVPAPQVQARLRAAFDPAGVLAPGRMSHA